MRLLIVDDHPIVRKGFITVLRDEVNDCNLVVDEADSYDSALNLIRDNDYELAVVDITLDGKSGIHLLQQIREEKPLLPVLIISTHGESLYALQTMRLGAAGYLSKHSAAEELATAVQQIRSTGKYISPTVALLLADAISLNPLSTSALHTRLSPREMEVASLLVSGKQIKEIAIDLGRSTKTISTHRTRLLEKLGLNNTIELVNYFSRYKLV
ncbi:MAG TPA: response regulator transcription factor [Desulfuromonadales bacterium]|nr:response regulator transcription factor [Desulfuromonadales bacterium]